VDPTCPEPPVYEALAAENTALREQVAELTEKLAAALAEIQRLKSERKGGGAPFSRGKRKEPRRRPGRKPGQGRFSRRLPPDYARCDVSEENAPLATSVCPDCGGPLGMPEYEEASTTEVPAMPRPRVKRFRVEVRRCTCCRKVVRGSHPELKPDQFGATAHRVGASVYAWSHWLHYGQGVPVRRIPAVLQQALGIPLTQGALTQDALRQVGEIGPPGPEAPPVALARVPGAVVPATGPIGQLYALLRVAIALEPVVHTDDTSWRIGGEPAWLMVFCSLRLVVYQIRDHHRNEEVREILAQFVGIMVCDRGSSYEARELATVRQQKCLSHLIRNIEAVLDYLPAAGRTKAETLLKLFREALALWRAYRRGETSDYAGPGQRIAREVNELLAPETYLNPVLNRLLNGIGRQQDQGHLLRFLADPQIEPTNNRAERDLRPAVIARKVSQCSRNDPGAEAHAAWSSVIATLVRQGVSDPVAALLECLQSGRISGLDLPEPPAWRVAGLPAAC
jgi:transposase